MGKLEQVTAHLMGIAMKGDVELFMADATLYLEFFGIIAIAWQWLIQATAAKKALAGRQEQGEINFYQWKLFTCAYFFGYELPKIEGLAKRLTMSDGVTVKMRCEYFVE